MPTLTKERPWPIVPALGPPHTSSRTSARRKSLLMAILDRLVWRYAPTLTAQWSWSEYRSRDWLYRLNDRQIADLETTAKCLIASSGNSVSPPYPLSDGYLSVLSGRIRVSRRCETGIDSIQLRPGESLRWCEEFQIVAESDSRLIWLDAQTVAGVSHSPVETFEAIAAAR